MQPLNLDNLNIYHSLHNSPAIPLLEKYHGSNIMVTKPSSTMCQIHFLPNFFVEFIQKLKHKVKINLKWSIIYQVLCSSTVTKLCTQVDRIFLNSVSLIWTFYHTTSYMKRCGNGYLNWHIPQPWGRKLEFLPHNKGTVLLK